MRRPGHNARNSASGLALVLGLGACFAKPTEEIILSPPRPSGTPQVHEERREGEPELIAALTNDLLDVTVKTSAECQQVTVTPMVQDNFARQTASKKIQAGNVVGASVFLGIGTVALLERAPGPSDPRTRPARHRQPVRERIRLQCAATARHARDR